MPTFAIERRDTPSMRQPVVVKDLAELRAAVRGWRAAGERIGLVPTMGALHRGHIALVERAMSGCDRVVVSIFVNPTQFAPHEDFSKYPRTLDADLAAMRDVAVDIVWLPTVETMYPHGFATSVVPAGPASVGLEDAVRPRHFSGVATVVCKLFNQVQPDVAIFGEKDFQQLTVIRRMTADLDLPVEIVGVETVREPSGLALSSRNVYLSDAQRAAAPALHAILQDVARAIAAAQDVDAATARGRLAVQRAGFVLDYLETRDARTLAPVTGTGQGPLRVLVAARLGATRLIDNLAAGAAGVPSSPDASSAAGA